MPRRIAGVGIGPAPAEPVPRTPSTSAGRSVRRGAGPLIDAGTAEADRTAATEEAAKNPGAGRRTALAGTIAMARQRIPTVR